MTLSVINDDDDDDDDIVAAGTPPPRGGRSGHCQLNLRSRRIRTPASGEGGVALPSGDVDDTLWPNSPGRTFRAPSLSEDASSTPSWRREAKADGEGADGSVVESMNESEVEDLFGGTTPSC